MLKFSNLAKNLPECCVVFFYAYEYGNWVSASVAFRFHIGVFLCAAYFSCLLVLKTAGLSNPCPVLTWDSDGCSR